MGFSDAMFSVVAAFLAYDGGRFCGRGRESPYFAFQTLSLAGFAVIFSFGIVMHPTVSA